MGLDICPYRGNMLSLNCTAFSNIYFQENIDVLQTTYTLLVMYHYVTKFPKGHVQIALHCFNCKDAFVGKNVSTLDLTKTVSDHVSVSIQLMRKL